MSTPEAVDATVVDEPHEHAQPSTAVARRERRSEVIRPLSATDLVDSFAQYQQLLPRLLSDADYQDAGGGRRFVKKSGWRKIATAFDLDVQIVGSTVERDDNGQPLRAEVIARAVAPSGRSMDGDGYCSIDESRFRAQSARQKLENDLRATAATRAKNRAIADLVGMGEVSAEEINHVEPAVAAEQMPEWARTVEPSATFVGRVADLIDDDGDQARALVERLAGHYNGVPQIVTRVVAALHAARPQAPAEPVDAEPVPDDGATA